jgi:AraC-like DNA-binding protein
MTTSESFATVRFSTADLPRQHRLAMWREHYANTVLRVDIEPIGDAAFEASLTTRALPDLHLLLGTMSVTRIARTRRLIDDGNDDLALIVNRRGALSACARGRDVDLGEGDGVLMNFGEITTFDRHSPGGSISLRIPRAILSSLVVDVDDAVMQQIPRHNGALKLLASYAKILLDENVPATPELCRLMAAHVHDLAALTLGATRDAADVARGRGIRAARLRAIKTYIMKNSSRRNLSVDVVAAHFGVTQRYVQRLFESEGSTFSAFLLGQRLTHAQRMLTEPKFAQTAASTIAYDAGFGDISYFNRCFRKRYGATPLDIRKASATQELGRA